VLPLQPAVAARRPLHDSHRDEDLRVHVCLCAHCNCAYGDTDGSQPNADAPRVSREQVAMAASSLSHVGARAAGWRAGGRA